IRRHDDRNRAGGLLSGTGRGASCGDHDMDMQSDQLGREVGQSLDLSLSIARLDDEVLPLDVAQLTETLPEPVEVGFGREAKGEPTDPEDFARQLRCGDERHHEDTQGKEEDAHGVQSPDGLLTLTPGMPVRTVGTADPDVHSDLLAVQNAPYVPLLPLLFSPP